ncbi:hypothetical protein ACH5RR_039267 [Cinchona calisaya]|uniref:Uncharacterized protein n=1 Tax=Cinchona calisaya TaxID=153742 RepID=A0ABD2XXT0_9GENT
MATLLGFLHGREKDHLLKFVPLVPLDLRFEFPGLVERLLPRPPRLGMMLLPLGSPPPCLPPAEPPLGHFHELLNASTLMDSGLDLMNFLLISPLQLLMDQLHVY